jgi:SAM-dependent methyltransferase
VLTTDTTARGASLGGHATRVYANAGNLPLIDLLDGGCRTVLDVGCGAGDNAALIRQRHPNCEIYGITRSAPEAALARRHMNDVWMFDIDGALPQDLVHRQFDALIFSHVLEHLRDPASALGRLSQSLKPGGTALIAVPNVLSWRQRGHFVLGRFEYQHSGALDDTHLRFFTYFTADRYLLSQSPDLKLKYKGATGSVPLWVLRRHVLPTTWSHLVDAWGCRTWPNLFGQQVLIKAQKEEA